MEDQLTTGFSWAWAIVCLAVGVLEVVAMWKIFVKAGQKGWAAIIPIYNVIVLLRVVERPWWWLLLLLVPFVNVVIAIIVMLDLAKVFGRGTGFGLGLIFLQTIFYCILAFGASRYTGRGGQPCSYAPMAA